MSRYRFELATAADDADLRQILAQTPTPGNIAVSYCREPSYFAAATVDGDFRQVVAARDAAAGCLVGFGSRSVRMRYVNGVPRPIGYLSNLRLLAEHRNRGLVARGYRYFRELHGDGRTPLYLTTIARGNETAMRLLTSGRAGLPAYHDAGEYHTFAIPLGRRKRSKRLSAAGPGPGSRRTSARCEIRPASAEDLPAMLSLLNEHGPTRQFFPHYTADDFFKTAAMSRDLEPGDILLALRAGRLVGMLGAWNQSRFRQCVVHGYSGALRWGRPLYNGWSRLRGLPPLPAVRQPFAYLIAAAPVVADDDLDLFRSLLDETLMRAASDSATHLLLGLHSSDPLLPIARAYRAVCYTTRLFLVCWDDGESLCSALDGRAPYLELGCL